MAEVRPPRLHRVINKARTVLPQSEARIGFLKTEGQVKLSICWTNKGNALEGCFGRGLRSAPRRAGSWVRRGDSQGARGTPGLAPWATGLRLLLSGCEGPAALKLRAGAQLKSEMGRGTYPVGLKQSGVGDFKGKLTNFVLRNKKDSATEWVLKPSTSKCMHLCLTPWRSSPHYAVSRKGEKNVSFPTPLR